MGAQNDTSISQPKCSVHLKIHIAASILCWWNRPSFIGRAVKLVCAEYYKLSTAEYSDGPVEAACVGEIDVSGCYINVNA